MKKVSARWVAHMLSDVQKADRDETSARLLSLFNENPENYLKTYYRPTSVDEARLRPWKVFLGNMSLLHLPATVSGGKLMSTREVMTTVFWDFEGIVLIDCLEHGSTITGTYYADLIRKCRAALTEETTKIIALRCAISPGQFTCSAHTSSQTRSAI